MGESIILEVAQLICSGIMAAAQSVTPFICAAMELFRQSIVVIALLIRKAITLPFYNVSMRIGTPKASEKTTKEALASLIKKIPRNKLVFGPRQGPEEFHRRIDEALAYYEETETQIGFVSDDPNEWPIWLLYLVCVMMSAMVLLALYMLCKCPDPDLCKRRLP